MLVFRLSADPPAAAAGRPCAVDPWIVPQLRPQKYSPPQRTAFPQRKTPAPPRDEYMVTGFKHCCGLIYNAALTGARHGGRDHE
jgi:hypothetical protein